MTQIKRKESGEAINIIEQKGEIFFVVVGFLGWHAYLSLWLLLCVLFVCLFVAVGGGAVVVVVVVVVCVCVCVCVCV